jgi:hypothetical protein
MTAEGSVYRRKDGRWVAQYGDARGKVRCVYRKTRGGAKKALREALQDRDEGYVPADKLTVGLYVEGWRTGAIPSVLGRGVYRRACYATGLTSTSQTCDCAS